LASQHSIKKWCQKALYYCLPYSHILLMCNKIVTKYLLQPITILCKPCKSF